MATLPVPYAYQRLANSREIRLISLSGSQPDDKISISIEHRSIDEKPEFVALSYVWGPQEPRVPVLCDGSKLTVGPNLGLLLRSLIRQGSVNMLYIDSLSINQEDLEERAEQVMLMGDIYSNAKIVLVWLGAELPSTKVAFESVRDLAREAMGAGDAAGVGAVDVSHVPYPTFSDPSARAIRELLAMDWFKRVWTFQEIVLSKAAVLKCGEHHMPWSNLENVLVSVEYQRPSTNYESSFLRGAEDAAFEMVKNRVYRRDPQLHTDTSGLANVSLMALLHQLRQRQATDPRDKIYALLNVAIDILPQDLRPDYRLSHLEVYANAAKWLLQKHESLTFLSLVEKKDKPDLVSWVPDFRSKDDMNFLHQARLTFRPTQEIWRACGSAKARRIPTDTPLLHLPANGVRVGKVVAMTDPPGNLMGNIALGAKVVDGGQWQDFSHTAAINGIYPPTGEPIDLAFYRSRVWDVLPGEATGRRSRTQRLTTSDFPPFSPPSNMTSIDSLLRWSRDDMASRVLNSTTRKRMIRTDSGYLGLARRCVEQGDEIWILMGLDTPCALRKIGGDFYTWGGEAYMHGAMDGEMLLRVSGRASMSEVINGASSEDRAWLESLGNQRIFPVTELILV